MNERLAGNRFLRGLVVPGGVRLDVSGDLPGVLTATLADTLAGLDSLMGRIEANPSVVDRLDHTGVPQHKAPLDLPLARIAAPPRGSRHSTPPDPLHPPLAIPQPP